MPDKEIPVTGVPGKVVLGVVGKAVDGRWDDAQRAARLAEGGTVSERVDAITQNYVRQLAVLGAAAGGTAAVPGVGTITALGATTAEIGAFAYRASEMILAIGAAHGHTDADTEERKAWVLSVLTFGRSAAAEFGATTAALGAGMTAEASQGGSGGWFHTVNRYLGRKLLARWGARRGAAMLGKILPFGIGAVFGAGTNYAVGRRIAQNADRFFAALPRRQPRLDLLPPPPLLAAGSR
jgi:hypothetical protein